MSFKRLVSILLCVAMILCNVLVNFATDNLNNEETTYEETMQEEIIIATNSEVEEECDTKEYEEEKEIDNEYDSAILANENDDSKENIEKTESSESSESSHETGNIEATQNESATSNEKQNDVIPSEEDANEATPSDAMQNDIVINKEHLPNINIDKTYISTPSEIVISSPSEINDIMLFGDDLDEMAISTNSNTSLKPITKQTAIATLSIVSKKPIATNSIIKKGQIKNYGYMPSNFKAKPAKREIEANSLLFGDDPIPSSYDSRNHQNASGLSIIPPVRDQGNYGTCWSFSTIGMFETSLRSKNLVTTEEDSNLSEAALAYFTLNLKNVTNSKNYIDKPGLGGRDYGEVNTQFFKNMGREEDATFANCGGNQTEPLLMASTYMGVVKENADTSYSKMPTILNKGLNGKYAFNSNDFEIGNAQFINKDDRDLIKRAIMKNGSVGTNYCEGRDEFNCHKFGDDYYYLSFWWCQDMANHAVLIVGWDDNIPKERFYTEDPIDDDIDDSRQATHDGGWLIRNSWGPKNEFMNAGYFWISYDDISFDNTFFTVEAIPKETYKYNYHYDTSGNDHDGVLSGVPLGNVFQVSDDEDQLFSAVNLALRDAGELTIDIYTSDSKMNSPTSGKKVLTQNFSTQTAGIFTINLNKEILLKRGTYFSIVLSPNGNSGLSIFIDNLLLYEGSPRSFYNEIALGQSFYSSNDLTKWIDLNSTDTKKINNITYGQNYRIRALTNPTEVGITFDANGGEGQMTRQGALRNTKVSIDANKFTRYGYVFIGWRDDNNEFYDNGSEITLNDNITLHAEWEEAYKITYIGNGGLYGKQSEYVQFVRKNRKATLDSCKFQYSGYSFNRWVSSDGKTYYNNDSISEVTSDLTLTAEWKRNKSQSTSSSSNNGGGSGGGGGGGGTLPNISFVPNTTENAISKPEFIQNADASIANWTFDPITNKFKLNININDQKIAIINCFYTINSVETMKVNDIDTQVPTQNTYYFDANGNMVTGWVKTIDGKTYFFENAKTIDEGKMIVGWKQIQSNWYYFNPDGSMLTNSVTPDGSTVGADGKWI